MIPEEYLENFDVCSAYLAAIIDGEGSVQYRKQKGSRWVSISNTEIEIINNCKKCCDVLGIKYGWYDTGNMFTHGTESRLTISGRNNLETLYRSAGRYMSNRKKTLMEEIFCSYKYNMHGKYARKNSRGNILN